MNNIQQNPEIEDSYLYFINFGIILKDYKHYILKPAAFFEMWLKDYAPDYAEQFIKLWQDGLENNFDSFNAIKKDADAWQAFQYINKVPPNNIATISRRVIDKYVALFGEFNDMPFEEFLLPTISQLYQHIIGFYQCILDETQE